MRRVSSAMTFISCLALCSLAAAGPRQAAPPAPQTWMGFVTDTHCGTHCQVTSNMTPDPKCIQECVKKGSMYGLLSFGKMYVLNPQSLASKYAAKNVKVTGTAYGEVINAKSIAVIPAAPSPAASKP
jgi:hypothetical protein